MPLVRAANTGSSAAFDAHGRELARLGLDREGTLEVSLPGKLPPPPFARLGLVIPGLLACTAITLARLGRWRQKLDDGDNFEN